MARPHIAYKYDDDLRHSILDVFDEAQQLASPDSAFWSSIGTKSRGNSGGHLGGLSRGKGEAKPKEAKAWKCPYCRSPSSTHRCPVMPETLPFFCKDCGSTDVKHDCPVQLRLEAERAREQQLAAQRLRADLRCLEAKQWRSDRQLFLQEQQERYRREAEERQREREARQLAERQRRERVEQARLRIQEQNRKQAELAAQLEEQRRGPRVANRFRTIPVDAKLAPPEPATFCSECGSAEKNHECKVALRLATLEAQARKSHRRKYQRARDLERLRQEPDTLPTAAE